MVGEPVVTMAIVALIALLDDVIVDTTALVGGEELASEATGVEAATVEEAGHVMGTGTPLGVRDVEALIASGSGTPTGTLLLLRLTAVPSPPATKMLLLAALTLPRPIGNVTGGNSGLAVFTDVPGVIGVAVVG